MKGITYCGACIAYDKKKHRCTAGACEEKDPRNPFYEDCPLPDVVSVVRCKDCRYYTERTKRCDHPCLDYDVECYDHWLEMEPLDFCSYGERKDND